MNKNYIKITLLLILALKCFPQQYLSGQSLPLNNKVILANVAGKEITLNDFYQRAEYTIRPSYCKGNLNTDKMIVLNSLIAEKLFSIEAGTENDLSKNNNFMNFIEGRKEQKMRELLRYAEGTVKVKLDANEVKQIYSIAGRTYEIQYFNIPDAGSANELFNLYKNTDSAFYKIYNRVSVWDSIPNREVAWSSKEHSKIHNALFQRKLNKGEMIGPVSVDDTTNIFINISGWTDRVVFTENDIESRLSEVKEYLSDRIADSLYDEFVYNVMKDKKVDFDVDVFNKLTKIAAGVYYTSKKDDENSFVDMVYKGNPEFKELSAVNPGINEIKDLPLLKIEDFQEPSSGIIWSVNDLINEIKKHPLVFRKQNIKDKFANQFRLAIVDLIRDKYLTEAAYQRGYDKNEIVTHYTETWYDASLAMFQSAQYFNSIGVPRSTSADAIEKYLNPYVQSLLKKYSGQIEINVDEFEKITLTRIDMFTTEDNVPYKIYVPAFPQITTHRRLDYGSKMRNTTN